MFHFKSFFVFFFFLLLFFCFGLFQSNTWWTRFIQSTIEQTDDNSSYQTLLLSLYLTQTLQEKSWKEDFRGRAKIPSGYAGVECHWYLPKQTCVSTPRQPLVLLQGGNISSSSSPPFQQWLLRKHSCQTPSQPCVFTERGGQAENLLFFFFFFPLLLCDFLASSPLCMRKRKRKDELHPVLLLVSITVHTRIPVELLHVQVILPSTLAAGLSQSCGC